MSLIKNISSKTLNTTAKYTSIIPQKIQNIQTRNGVTETARFREIWHQTDSLDPLYDLCKKPVASQRMDPTRRAHYYVCMAGVYGTGLMIGRNAIDGIVHYLWYPADVAALSTIEVKKADIPIGKCVVIMWGDAPVYVWHRNAEQIATAERDDALVSEMRDPQLDSDRVKDKSWYISSAACTHLGCIPTFGAGNFGGFFCPCHGSHYDAAGRIRLGPAPMNFDIPPYSFDEEDNIIIGK
mmetsp:Transcript_98382/g.120504  ORF Transcript_98382/g.120504 Transcript_98382/m.120504 type:complete len:239 (+) Transcript_98382:555-1271(+)|eukprot:CAMPEP_0114681328 /NCGR_PEP_ID=MMETSP0191-20121206/55248_1 /TAXON_ID=126664 /ORGANISM="Sorites sp." /LENGTH=238 /DNA_ID=CAMNT_0001959461 /DNA_START=1475 /DNA_END=2191 /DNA_ORIENTATION=-